MISQPDLKVLIAVYGVRIDAVAKATNLSAPYVSRIVSGQTQASPALVARLEQAIVGQRPAAPHGAEREAVRP